MPISYTYALPPGLYVLKNDKPEVKARIDELARLFNRQLGDKSAVAQCKDCCHRLIVFIDDCFHETFAREKCKRGIQGFITDDINRAREYGQQMLYFLIDLHAQIDSFVSFDDLPSCRSLLDCSPEEAALKAVDLVGSGVVKVISKSIAIGSDVFHIIEISDVRSFYSAALQLLQTEKAQGWEPRPIETFFGEKCKMELEYCKLAALKVAGNLTSEVLENTREAIEEYQRRIDNARYSRAEIV